MKNMKMTIVLVTAVAAATCLAAVQEAPIPKDKSKFHLFLLIGQSNMAGRGYLNATNRVSTERVLKLDACGRWVAATEPLHFDKRSAGAGIGASFARAVADRDPSITVGLIPAAWGGTAINEWNGERACSVMAVQRTLRAMEDGELKAILWHQGCSDSGSMGSINSYMPKLSNTVSFIRSWLKKPDVPFIAGELGDCLVDNPYVKKGKGPKFWKEFNERLHHIGEYVPNSAWVDGFGFKCNPDGIHFDTPSLRAYGLRFADVYFKMMEKRVSPDGTADQSAAINDMIRRLPDGGTLIFEPGNYRLRSPLVVEGKHDFTLRGLPGATILAHSSPSGTLGECTSALHVRRAERFRMESLRFSTDSPVNAAGRIVAMDKDSGTFDVETEEEFPMTGDEHIAGFDTCDMYGMPDRMLEMTGRYVREDGGKTLRVIGVPFDFLGAHRIRFKAPGGPRFDFSRLKDGHRVAMRYSLWGAMMVFADVRGAVIRDVEVDRCNAVAMMIEPKSADFSFERFCVRPREGSKALLSANADGIHALGLSGKLTLQDCHFRNLGDDALNVHSKAGIVKAFDAASGKIAVVCRNHLQEETRLPAHWADAGDTLAVYEPKTLVLKGKVSLASYSGGKGRVAERTCTLETGDILANENDCPEVLIERCSCTAMRARGFLIQTSHVRVRDCEFSDIALSGLLFSPDMTVWYEAGPSTDVTIERCRFVRCCTAAVKGGVAAISFRTSHGHESGACPAGVHTGIAVRNCSFTDCGGASLSMDSVKGAVIAGNTFKGKPGMPFDNTRPTLVHDIWLRNCADIELSGNTTDSPASSFLRREFASVAAGGLTATTAPAEGRRSVPFIYCSDIFHPAMDPDDHFDLAALFALKEFDVKAVILDGHIDRKGQDQFNGGGRIPLSQMERIAGYAMPSAIGFNAKLSSPLDKLEDYEARYQGGVALMRKVLVDSPVPVAVKISTGTDLAVLFNREPELCRRKIRAVYMNAGHGAGGATDEYNVSLDPVAFTRIFETGLPIYWSPCFGEGRKVGDGHCNFFVVKNQRELLEGASAELSRFFSYAILRSTADPMAWLSDGSAAEVPAKPRWMWTPPVLSHAAGRREYRTGDGTYAWLTPNAAAAAGLSGREMTVWRFEPAKVTVVEAARAKGVVRVEYGVGATDSNVKVFRQISPEYGQVMTSCLRSLYSTLGK